MNITPTQFKQLLLEEAGNCTEPQHVIFSIVKDMDPNDVAELFQDVFEQLPGVEMTRLDPEDEEPIPTSYQPGGEFGDRPVVGFKEQLMEMIREELSDHDKAAYEAGYAHGEKPDSKCPKDKNTSGGVGVPCNGNSYWEQGFRAGRAGL